jgi:hypothetical protein
MTLERIPIWGPLEGRETCHKPTGQSKAEGQSADAV